MSTTPKNQHYVWQHYLKGWATNDKLYCYRQRDKKLFNPNTRNIASKAYFYRTDELTQADLDYLERVIGKGGSDEMKESNAASYKCFS